MTIAIFCGPTLPRELVRTHLDADVRPPAARGDLLRTALQRPAAIGLIDGYFDRVPSVWHKEILWAMSEGIHVFGSASMGALRAAELAPFGMVGVGAIFESFRSGDLADDDEVAIAHATDQFEYRVVSEAMVNMRATFRAAHRDKIITQETLARMETIAKGMPYFERRYEAVLRKGLLGQLPRGEIDAFRDWLRTGRVDQKRDDAIAMLKEMAECARIGFARKTVDYVFAHTDAWEALYRSVRSERSARGRHGEAYGSEIVDELLVAGLAGATFDRAIGRALSLELARRARVDVDSRAVEAVADDFRRERALLRPEDFDQWLKRQEIEEAEISAYFRREATIRKVKEGVEAEILDHVADHLRSTGEYGALVERARAKQLVLSARGLDSPDLGDTKRSETELWEWYFGERLHRGVPDDLHAYAQSERSDLDQLRSAVVREFLYEILRGERKPSV